MRKNECIPARAPCASPKLRGSASIGGVMRHCWLLSATWCWLVSTAIADVPEPTAPKTLPSGDTIDIGIVSDASIRQVPWPLYADPTFDSPNEGVQGEWGLSEWGTPPTVEAAHSAVAEEATFDPSLREGLINSQVRPSREEGFQVLPEGLLYRSYLAGEKEPRFQLVPFRDLERRRRVWESVLGGRAGLLRYGTYEAVDPEGFQLDLEGAALARVLPDEPSHMLESVDFRFGFVGTWRHDQTAIKMGYYHISSHLGDEFLLANPTFARANYVRDAAVMGIMRDLSDDWQIYGEMGYAMGAQGGAKPLEFQVGTQYTPIADRGIRGSPFIGINSYVREDFGYRQSMNLVAGWQWLGANTRHLFRAGMQYFNGPSMQYSFPNRHDELLGGGIWLDF